MSPVKRICVFEHSVMTSFNCACPAIQRGQGSGFLSEGSSWLTACMSEQRRFWRDCADAQARLNLRCSHRWQVPNSLDAVQIVWLHHKWISGPLSYFHGANNSMGVRGRNWVWPSSDKKSSKRPGFKENRLTCMPDTLSMTALTDSI